MIGLLGGTFNPIHLGHLSIAQEVLDHFKLNAVHFLPCHTPVHREAPSILTEHRLTMLQLALQDKDKFEIDLTEIDRGGPSYMIDSLKVLVQSQHETLVLILGTDAFNDLPTWKHAKQILKYCHIVVCQRPDETLLQTEFNVHEVKDVKQLSLKATGCIYFLDVKPTPCSSTFIRKNSTNREAITQYLPHPVLEFIQSNNLYASNKI